MTVAASPFLAFLVVVATTNGLHHLHGIHSSEAAQLFTAAIIELHLLGWGALAYTQVRCNKAMAAIGMPPPAR